MIGNGKKDFYSIADLSKEWDEFSKNTSQMSPEWSGKLREYHASFTLAIAQQLAVIAGHLGAIVGKSKELKKNGVD